jgi:MFS family permease
VAAAPVVGPTLGGWLADNLTWRWCFIINGPVGVLAFALIAVILREPAAAIAERRRQQRQGGGFDRGGFVLVATFLGALEIVLDRGLEDDWFASPFIVRVAAVCALAFVLMIPGEMRRRNPMIDLRMVATRQFGARFVVMLGTGAILLATTQFLPELVQQDFGYTATWAGLVLSPGGVVTMAMMFVAGRLSAKVQPKYLIAIGAALIALSMYDLTSVYGDLGFWFLARSRMLLGLGLPLVFIPILTASYDGVPPARPTRPRPCSTRRAIPAARSAFPWSPTRFGRAVPSEPAYRPGGPVERPIPAHAAADDELFRCSGQLARGGQTPGNPMDWSTVTGAGLVFGLCGRLLAPDADFAHGRAAGTGPAEGQAGRSRPGRP